MFMMANIIANFVLLAAYDPLNTATTTQDKVQNDLEPWFQAVRAAPCRRSSRYWSTHAPGDRRAPRCCVR
jgi:hypothetical protein